MKAIVNNFIKDIPEIPDSLFENTVSIYEVIRIFNGQPLFLEDNLKRLANSLSIACPQVRIKIQELNIPEKITRLIRLEHIEEGNIKYVLSFKENRAEEYLFRIPHHYPDKNSYINGVPTISLYASRKNPELKYINPELRTIADNLIRKHKVWEVLLTDADNYLTEGSRSNLFFIKGDIVFTAPSAFVLPGTSRKRVFEICNIHHIKIVEKKIALSEIRDYDSAFLTGTSPLLLPISRINQTGMKTNTPLLKKLVKLYFEFIGIKF